MTERVKPSPVSHIGAGSCPGCSIYNSAPRGWPGKASGRWPKCFGSWTHTGCHKATPVLQSQLWDCHLGSEPTDARFLSLPLSLSVNFNFYINKYIFFIFNF